jgi:hypothetical protein
MRFDPRASPGPHAQLATAYYVAGRYRDTVAYIDAAPPPAPGHVGLHAIRAAALAQLGNLDEARRSAETVRRISPRFSTEDAGTRFRNPEHAARLREGLAKAGL